MSTSRSSYAPWRTSHFFDTRSTRETKTGARPPRALPLAVLRTCVRTVGAGLRHRRSTLAERRVKTGWVDDHCVRRARRRSIRTIERAVAEMTQATRRIHSPPRLSSTDHPPPRVRATHSQVRLVRYRTLAAPIGHGRAGSPLVVRLHEEGLEPPRLAAPEPKSGASANSATRACLGGGGIARAAGYVYRKRGVVGQKSAV